MPVGDAQGVPQHLGDVDEVLGRLRCDAVGGQGDHKNPVTLATNRHRKVRGRRGPVTTEKIWLLCGEGAARGSCPHGRVLHPGMVLYGLDGAERREPVVDEQEVGGERGELLCQIDTEGVQKPVWRRPAQCAFHCHASIHGMGTAFRRDVEMTGVWHGRRPRPRTSEECR